MAARIPTVSLAEPIWVMRPVRQASFLMALPGHLAVWVGLYVGAAVASIELLVSGAFSIRIAGLAVLAAIATYLVDRVGLSLAWVDPADSLAHPQRAALMRHHQRSIRWLIVALITTACLLAASLGWYAVGSVLAAPLGVVFYGTRRFTCRPKDRLILKNLCVACAITAFAIVLSLGTNVSPTAILVGVVYLLLVIFADAMLCDLDDAEADARHGTRTIPNSIGVPATWRLAVAINIVAMLWLMAAAWASMVPARPAGLLGSCVLAGALLLFLVRPQRCKDLVDIKLPIAVVIVWFVLHV